MAIINNESKEVNPSTTSVCSNVEDKIVINPTRLSINLNTLNVFLKFYHDKTCSGTLSIDLFDLNRIGTVSTLKLIMTKKIDSSIGTYHYEFYVEFSCSISSFSSKHPLNRVISFDGFPNEYNKYIDEYSLKKILTTHLNKEMFEIFSDQYFDCKLELCVDPIPVKAEEKNQYSIKEEYQNY